MRAGRRTPRLLALLITASLLTPVASNTASADGPVTLPDGTIVLNTVFGAYPGSPQSTLPDEERILGGANNSIEVPGGTLAMTSPAQFGRTFTLQFRPHASPGYPAYVNDENQRYGQPATFLEQPSNGHYEPKGYRYFELHLTHADPFCSKDLLTCTYAIDPSPPMDRSTSWFTMRAGDYQLPNGMGHIRQRFALIVKPGVGGGPTATFTSTQDKTDPFTFAFDATNSSDAPITAYEWNFGDGKTSEGVKVSHTFAKPGAYTVVLTARDAKRRTGTYQVRVSVSPLVVRLLPGVSNGRRFSVDVEVRNAATTPLTDVAFKYGVGVFETGLDAPGTAGTVKHANGPRPPLPTTLAPGERRRARVVLGIVRTGGLDLGSVVTATGADGKVEGIGKAIVQIGVREVSAAEARQATVDLLMDGFTYGSRVYAAGQQRLSALMAWALGPHPDLTLPAWLDAPLSAFTPAPPGTVAAGPTPDDMFARLAEEDRMTRQLAITFFDRMGQAGLKVGSDTLSGSKTALITAGEFYRSLYDNPTATTAEASHQFNRLLDGVSETAMDGLGRLTELGITTPENQNPFLFSPDPTSAAYKEYETKTREAGDAAYAAAKARFVAAAAKAKSDPEGFVGDVGDAIGTFGTSFARDALVAEFGLAFLPRAAGAVERTVDAVRTKIGLPSRVSERTAALGAARASGAGVVARQSLESLGEEAHITINQLEKLAGIYGPDSERVQKIIKDVKAKFDVDIEIQIRPGNPASLKYYKDGTGVPKPEWIKPKASEWMDVVLGAPDSTLGRATIYPPRKPSAAELARYSRAEQLQITQRYAKQVELFDDATKPGGKMYQLLQDSKRAEGATVTTGFGTNAKQIKVRYSLEPVGDSGAFLIKDELAGGKYVLSDADIQAAIKASTGKHIPAAEGRGAIERYVMERFEKDLVSFGRHGWSHSGVDLAAKWSKSWLEFNMGSMSVGDARAMAQWFLTGKHDWVDALAKQLGRPVTADDLLALFRPGSFVVKFNGTNMRVGYAAGIR